MKLIAASSLLSSTFAFNTIGEIITSLQGKVSWQVGESSKWDTEKTASHYSYLFGTLMDDTHDDLPIREDNYGIADSDIPTNFDSRTQWGDICPSINEIRDQASCGSCWAFGSAEAFSDRVCIATNGAYSQDLSAEDILSCCHSCGMGCNGGYLWAAWNYFNTTGIVSGGLYDGTGCRPYSIAPCDHHVETPTDLPNCADVPNSSTPRCSRKCVNGDNYSQDKHFTKNAYKVGGLNARKRMSVIQKEIMTNGPVEAAFNVYEDFMAYTGGVYYHQTGDFEGGHAIKIIGWGTDDTDGDYWIIANSWNPHWGENGFFRMRRGNNECNIEAKVYAGEYDAERSN